jgi:hypothetical protein
MHGQRNIIESPNPWSAYVNLPCTNMTCSTTHNAFSPSFFPHEHIATWPQHRVRGLVNGQYIASYYVGVLSLAMSIGLCIPNDDGRAMVRRFV